MDPVTGVISLFCCSLTYRLDLVVSGTSPTFAATTAALLVEVCDGDLATVRRQYVSVGRRSSSSLTVAAKSLTEYARLEAEDDTLTSCGGQRDSQRPGATIGGGLTRLDKSVKMLPRDWYLGSADTPETLCSGDREDAQFDREARRRWSEVAAEWRPIC